MSSVIREWKNVRRHEETVGPHDSGLADQRDSIVLYCSHSAEE